MRKRTGVHGWKTLTMFTVFSSSILGCGGAPTAAEDPVDPDGVWTFGIVVTVATGICVGEVGESSAQAITIMKTGSAPPYDITASGFLGVSTNILTGTFDENNRLVISGSYPEDQGTTTATHDLIATSDDRMEGTESWAHTDPTGSCTNSMSDVTADRL